MRGLFLYIILAVPACFSPIAIDLIVPSLPALADAFAARLDDTQLTVYSFTLAYGLAPFFWGAMSDRYGRKPLLIAGILSFCAASIACAFAQSIEILALLRFVQGFVAAAGIVLSRAILRDIYGASGTVRAIANLYLCLAALPVLVPLLGGYLSEFLVWSDLFLLIAGIAFASLLTVIFGIKETLPKTDSSMPLSTNVIPARSVLTNRHFMCNAMANIFAMAATLIFITNYSPLSSEIYSVSAKQNGYVLALYNLAIGVGLLIARFIVPKIGAENTMSGGIACLLLGWVLVAALCAGAPPPMLLLLVVLLLPSFGHGLIMGLAPGQALIPFNIGAGKASAIFSCIQAVGAALLSYGFVLWANVTLSSAAIAMVVCALCSALCYYLIRPRSEQVPSRV